MQGKNLFKEIKNGDEAAFSKLFDLYYSPLCFFADKYLQDMDFSRSLVQQVFVDIWSKRDKLSIDHSEKSYLYTAVKNRSLDFLKKHKRNVSVEEINTEKHQTPFQDYIEEAELNNRINKLINNLPERCREVFTLCRFEGMKYKQIADQMGISVKTVEMQMGIALKRLREGLPDYQMMNLLVFLYSRK